MFPRPVQHDVFKGVGISIIIPSKYEDDYIVKTLKYIFEATPPNLLYEVIVIDDESTNHIAPFIEQGF